MYIDILTTKKQIMENDSFFGYRIQYASKEIRDDYDVAMKFCKRYGAAFEFLSDRLRDDRQLLLESINSSYESPWNISHIIKSASDRLKNDKELIKIAVKVDAFSFFYASSELKKDIPFIIELMDINPSVIGHVYKAIKDKVFMKVKDQIKEALEGIKNE